MDEKLQHDPRTKTMIKDMLYAFLYEPVQKQFKARLDAIINKNTQLLGASHNSFIYKGIIYSCDPSKQPRKMNRLVPQLESLMNDYLKETHQINTCEAPYVLGFIIQVLNSSNDLQDYLRIFPSSIHRPIENLIESCPYHSKRLAEADISDIQNKNASSIELMKKRMVINLLI